MSNKVYINDFIQDLNYRQIALDISNIDFVNLKRRLKKDAVNKLYRVDNAIAFGVSIIHIENCDVDYYHKKEDYKEESFKIYELNRDKVGWYYEK